MSKTITIDNQEYELVPIAKYKAGDWILFNNGGTKPVVRKIVEDDAYAESKGGGHSLDDKYKEWMTENAAKSYVKDIVGKAYFGEIRDHLRLMAKEKGIVKGVKARGVTKTVFHTLVQDDVDYYYDSDEFAMSGMIIYAKGIWAEIEKAPQFTFGGVPVEFDVKASHAPKGIEVIIKCKGVTGNATELAEILTHFFRPMSFGGVLVKKWTLKGEGYDTTIGIPSFYAGDSSAWVENITIGCLTGKYSELVAIYKQSQEILKNWKPAKGFDK